MTQENKEILLKVLSEQLPYGVLILDTSAEKYGKLYQINSDFVWYDCQKTGDVEFQTQTIFNVKPYLRSMSSMTEEEKKELSVRYVWRITYSKIQIRYHSEGYWDNDTECPTEEYLWLFDWLNSHHFDYRGLIEKGLAIEAPEEMYKNE